MPKQNYYVRGLIPTIGNWHASSTVRAVFASPSTSLQNSSHLRTAYEHINRLLADFLSLSTFLFFISLSRSRSRRLAVSSPRPLVPSINELSDDVVAFFDSCETAVLRVEKRNPSLRYAGKALSFPSFTRTRINYFRLFVVRVQQASIR